MTLSDLLEKTNCPACGVKPCLGDPECGLTYIAHSPSREHGGFHENAVLTAQQALVKLSEQAAEIERLKGKLDSALGTLKFTRSRLELLDLSAEEITMQIGRLSSPTERQDGQ